MSTLAPSLRGKSWVFQVTALSIVLGMLLAMSLKTHTEARRERLSPRPNAEGALYWYLKNDNDKLSKQVADYKDRYEKVAKKQAAGVYGTRDFQKLFDETKTFAGTSAVHGPGVVVVLRDSPKRNAPGTSEDVMSQYIIHERDIRDVANELFCAGAEAVSVNGQRLTANSSVRCVGGLILVNLTRLPAPFTIKAIGKPDAMEGALRLPGGPLDGLFLLDMIAVTKEPDIAVPAYTGSTRFSFARPVAQKPE